MDYPQFRRELARQRDAFRAGFRQRGENWFARYPGKIGVVLSGGGARGAYEAGALLAFQDAQMPTHILAASSVGSINAAFYAAHSSTLVGNAEPLVDSWAEISSPAVGIDWSRYIFMLAGLVAATAGFFNALRNWSSRYISLHADNPVLTWLALMFAGSALLLLYDQLPYIAYVILNYARGGRWKPDVQKAVRSLAANFLVWGFAYLVLNFTHLHIGGTTLAEVDLGTRMLLLLLLVPAIVYLSYRSLAGLGPVRRWLAIGLRSSLVILLTLALADARAAAAGGGRRPGCRQREIFQQCLRGGAAPRSAGEPDFCFLGNRAGRRFAASRGGIVSLHHRV